MKQYVYWDSYSGKYLKDWESNHSRIILRNFEKMFISHGVGLTKREGQSERTYIDMGCGPGRIIDFIRNIDKRYKMIIGIDSNKKMVDLCRKTFKNESRISIRLGDITKPIRVGNGKTDVVTCIRVLKYLPNQEDVFRSVVRILRPGGVFIFTVTNKHSIAYFDALPVKHYKDTIGNIESRLSDSGLSIVYAQGFQRLPEFVHIAISAIGLTKELYLLEKLLNRLLGDTFLVRTLYIIAQYK